MATNLYPSAMPTVDRDVPFRILGGFAAFCFISALVSDIVYARDPDFVWTTFSIWAITIGLFVALAAVVVGLIDRIVHGRLGALGARWPYLLGYAIVVVLEIFNAFVHSRDAYESVVPDGIVLSAIAVVLLVLTQIVGRAMFRTRTRKAPL